MFDFAWSEIAVIGVVALIAIGPKDMPVAIKAVTNAIKKARRMAAEFQSHVDEMVREADLHEVRDSLSEIRNFDFKGAVERTVDPDGSLRTTLASNPLAPDPVIHAPAPADAESATELRAADSATPAEPAEIVPRTEPTGPVIADDASETVPAFIPPAFAIRPAPAPAFVPPGVKRHPAVRA